VDNFLHVFQNKNLNKEIHKSIFDQTNPIFYQYLRELAPTSDYKFTIKSVPDPALCFILLNLRSDKSIPLYLSLNDLNPKALKPQKSIQKELFLENNKTQILSKLSENLRHLYEKGSIQKTQSSEYFTNNSIKYLINIVKDHFKLETISTAPTQLENHPDFVTKLTDLHIKSKVNIPFFKLSLENKNKDNCLSLQEYVERFFEKDEKQKKSKRVSSSIHDKKEIDFQFLMITLEYELNMGNKRSRDLDKLVEKELKKRKTIPANQKMKVCLKFAKYLLDKDISKIEMIKDTLARALKDQKNDYKLNHYMGLVLYKEIKAKILAKDTKDKDFYELVSNTLKYFIKSIANNTSLSRKFVIQGKGKSNWKMH
jgi:hypothetical protein